MGLYVQLQFFPFIIGNTTPYDPNTGVASARFTYVQFDDNAQVWFKPLGNDIFKFTVGKYVDDTLRGKVTDHWMRRYTVQSFDADEIFTRFRGQPFATAATPENSNVGVLLTSKINDLFIGVNFPGLIPFESGGANSGISPQGAVYEMGNLTAGRSEFTRVYERTQIAVAYTIPDIGQVRVQYVGANPGITAGGLVSSFTSFVSTMDTYSAYLNGGTAPSSTPTALPGIANARFEAAFQFRPASIKGFFIDIGGKFQLPVTPGNFGTWQTTAYNYDTGIYEPVYDFVGFNTNDYDFTFQPSYGVSLGIQYFMDVGDVKDAFKLNARIDTRFAGYIEVNKVDGARVVNKLTNGTGYRLDFPFELNAHLWPTIEIVPTLIIGVDIGFGWYGQYEVDGNLFGKSIGNEDGWNGGMRFGGGLYVQKNITPNGWNNVKAGLAYSHGAKVNGIQEDMVFTIPVMFESRF